MKNKGIFLKQLKIFLSKLDIFSKLLLVLMLLLVFVVGFNYFSSIKFSESKKIVEIDTKTGIEILDYVFETGTKIRWPSDTYLVVNLSKVINEDEKKNIEVRVRPEQRTSLEFIENNLIIKFLDPSPKDTLDRNIIILYSGKQIGRIEYYTSDVESAGADFDFNDLSKPRRDQ